MTDEQILGRQLDDSWYTQQLVKLNFFRLNIAENYLWIDSDFLFIKDFSMADFFAYPNVPYFVCGDINQDIITWTFTVETQGKKYKDMIEQVRHAMNAIQQKFGRTGPQYGFGAPAIWNKQVLEYFDHLLSSQGLSFDNLIAEIPFELNWYGEFALANRIIPIVPHKGFAYHITTDEQANFIKAIGIDKERIAAHGYIAVTIAAKWNIINPEEWI